MRQMPSGAASRPPRVGARARAVSQQAVARAAGVSGPRLGRIERGEIGAPDSTDLAAIAAVLGLTLRIGDVAGRDSRLRDHVQLRLLEAFRERLHASLTWRTEVPLPISGDRRAWDAVVGTPDGMVRRSRGSAALGAVDATIRRANLKLRGRPTRSAGLVLVVIDTAPESVGALRAALATVRADYPLDTRGHAAGTLGPAMRLRLNGVVVLRLPPHERRPQAVHTGWKTVDAGGPAGPKFVDKPVGAPAPGP